MNNTKKPYTNRRAFIKSSAGIMAAITAIPKVGISQLSPLPSPAEGLHLIGPISGFSPQVGTLVTMLNWMQDSLLNVTNGLSQQDLDFLFDAKANTIGALILHMASIEVFYQDTTFYGLKDLSERNKKKWSVAMNLGEAAQKEIKGKNMDYYLAQTKEVRDKTLADLKQRDDTWLAAVDPAFFNKQPTNNYCKWFHVCEHIGNHRGQISWIRNRLPGSRTGKD